MLRVHSLKGASDPLVVAGQTSDNFTVTLNWTCCTNPGMSKAQQLHDPLRSLSVSRRLHSVAPCTPYAAGETPHSRMIEGPGGPGQVRLADADLGSEVAGDRSLIDLSGLCCSLQSVSFYSSHDLAWAMMTNCIAVACDKPVQDKVSVQFLNSAPHGEPKKHHHQQH